MMQTVLITGGTGMIGTALTKALLDKGYRVIILSRTKEKQTLAHPQLQYAVWDVSRQYIDTTAINQADALIHLAGAGIADKRWTKQRKQEIRDSRVNSASLLVKSLEEVPNKIKTVVSASAIGWYGPDPVVPNPHPFSEEKNAYDDYLGQTCKEWEASIIPAATGGRRLVIYRAGIVLSAAGGALAEYRKPLQSGIAAIMSKGTQMVSWVHLQDLVRLYINAIENEKTEGIYNAVAPQPVSNKEFVMSLGRAMRGNTFLPLHVPAFILKIALGEMSIEVLKSATVSCDKIRSAGFQFNYPTVISAFNELFQKERGCLKSR